MTVDVPKPEVEVDTVTVVVDGETRQLVTSGGEVVATEETAKVTAAEVEEGSTSTDPKIEAVVVVDAIPKRLPLFVAGNELKTGVPAADETEANIGEPPNTD